MSDAAGNRVISGGQALAQMLALHRVGPMFGMGGFQLLPFYDALRRLNLRHTLINDERCGVFAADAYAKLSGRVGVCDATLGPGATNLVTGLVEALNAGTPLVVIVGDAHRLHAGKHMTQETAQADILRPACKTLLRVEHAARIPELTRRAFQLATSGRPGPVVLSVPEDVCHAEQAYDPDAFYADERFTRIPALRCRPDAGSVAAAAKALAEARRPLVLAGGGVHLSSAAATLQRLAEAAALPVAHTMSGKGAIACTHPLSAGLFGRYDRIANALIEASDCLLVVGCKLGEIATRRYALPLAGRTLIHVDSVAEEFGRTTRPTLPLWGDVGATLAELHKHLDGWGSELALLRGAYLQEVAEKMRQWRDSVADKLNSDATPIGMARLLNELNAALPDDAVLVADGGFAAHWGGLLYDTKRPGRGFVPDRGFASIGYGLPGAIGAKLAAPASRVVALTGDGGCNMSLGELETARRLGLAFTLIVVNNAASGYVKALQHLMYGGGSYQSSDLSDVDYAGVAEALGCRGIRVERPGEIAAALRAAAEETERPTLLDVVVTRDPAQMLPGVDSRTAQPKAGDRPA